MKILHEISKRFLKIFGRSSDHLKNIINFFSKLKIKDRPKASKRFKLKVISKKIWVLGSSHANLTWAQSDWSFG